MQRIDREKSSLHYSKKVHEYVIVLFMSPHYHLAIVNANVNGSVYKQLSGKIKTG